MLFSRGGCRGGGINAMTLKAVMFLKLACIS